MPTMAAVFVPLKPASFIAASDSHVRNYGNVRRHRLGERRPRVKHKARAFSRALCSGLEILGLDLVEEIPELIEQGFVFWLVVGEIVGRHQADLLEQGLLRVDRRAR